MPTSGRPFRERRSSRLRIDCAITPDGCAPVRWKTARCALATAAHRLVEESAAIGEGAAARAGETG
jgi:hypothetical protein